MRSFISAVVLSAIVLGSLAGCDGGGGIEEGVPKDALKQAPPAMPGMDTMKDKMSKKKK